MPQGQTPICPAQPSCRVPKPLTATEPRSCCDLKKLKPRVRPHRFYRFGQADGGSYHKSRIIVALVSQGKPSFYHAWGGNLSDEELKGFTGPGLEIMSPPSLAAKAFLDQFKAMLQEQAYHEQLIRHYTQVKYTQGMQLPQASPGLVSALWL